MFLTNSLSQTLVDLLEYGIPGLSAIILLLTYNLLRTQNKRKEPNESMLKIIKSFMWIALTFLFISGAVNITEKVLDNSGNISTNAVSSLVHITAKNMGEELFILNKNHSYSTSSGTVGKAGGGGSFGEPGIISEPYISEEMTAEDFNYRKIKQAVFLSIQYSGANMETIKKALIVLEKRGYEIEESSITKIVEEFDDLLKLRYQWLEKGVIPEAQKQVSSFPPQIQSEPYAEVKIPKEIWMFSSYRNGEEPFIRIEEREIETYRNELQLLKEQIQ